ncbi:hypothetical protein [Pseudonocardia oroxyli]|uniref:hypothetical protein n=1 Tax=Pseudonocardia oroxyli TaxID=366584 RepID=UPI00115FFA64|nr:hypothetical protein [Pseudonocardia oroxyli]
MEMEPESGSLALVRAALDLNRAVRLLEFGQQAEASIAASRVIGSLQDLGEFERFPTSDGISWDSDTVQHDLVEAFTLRSKRLLSSLAALQDNSWVELVRSRPAWLDVRSERRAIPGLSAVLTKQYEDKYNAHSRSITIGGVDKVAAPIEASLFNSELSGDFGDLTGRRSQLGMARLLSASPEDSDLIRDGIRLLRQGRAKKQLESALSHLLLVGPVQPLLDQAATVLAVGASRTINSLELLVLRKTAELLTQAQAATAVEAALRYLNETGHEAGSTSSIGQWPRIEEAWKAIAELTPFSASDEAIAKAGASMLLTTEETPYLLSRLISSLFDKLSWRDITPSTQRDWLDWAARNQDGEFSDVSSEIIDQLLPKHSLTSTWQQRPSGIQLAERLLIEHGQGSTPDEAELTAAVDSLATELERIRRDAANHTYSLGGRPAARIASFMVTQLKVGDLVAPLANFLADTSVSASDKQGAIDHLSYHSVPIPSILRTPLIEKWDSVKEAPDQRMLVHDSVEFLGACLRLGVKIGTIQPWEFAASVTELAAGSPTERLVALRCLANTRLPEQQDIWAVTVAIQQAISDDSVVRANAAFVLARLRTSETPLRAVADERVRTLLQSDGVRTPLFCLRGLTSRVGDGGAISGELLADVERLADEHPATTVREAAIELASAVSGKP